MADPNLTEIAATTIENRSGTVADNVTKHTAFLSRLTQRGNVRTVSGGTKIIEELSYAENPNGGFYSGVDVLPTAQYSHLTAAEFTLKQAAVPFVITGLETLQNSGREQIIDMIEQRLRNTEATMTNLLAGSVYSDGTGYGGKEPVGMDSAIPVDPTTGTYGGINRATWSFWRSQYLKPGSAITKDTVQGHMNDMYSRLVRNQDYPDLIVMDSEMWKLYLASLQPQQRFTDPGSATLGFATLKYMNSDVVLDGGIGSFCPARTAFFVNTKYFFWRPHAARNMVPLRPRDRVPFNQDVQGTILAWAGAITCSGAQLHGRLESA